jgi:hypothetical protein
LELERQNYRFKPSSDPTRRQKRRASLLWLR